MVFNTTQSDLMHLTGKSCKIIRQLTSLECDDEVGVMYLICIGGILIHAYADEISV